MAYANVRTSLPLDRYAEIMAIPGWLFNQTLHPAKIMRGVCSGVVKQSGYFSDPNMITGRNEIARAIALAEQRAARFLGFWPFHDKWMCADEIVWPSKIPFARPTLRSSMGYVIEGGVEQWQPVASGVDVVYSDSDGDGVTDWATITVDLDGLIDDACEVAVVPHDYNPPLYEIRPLHTEIDVYGMATIAGWKWLFLEPQYYMTDDEAMSLNQDDLFLRLTLYTDGVDIYRHYNDPSRQAQIVYANDPCAGPLCAETCQSACITMVDRRLGLLTLTPAEYLNGVWQLRYCADGGVPIVARLWYKSGYGEPYCHQCGVSMDMIEEAIVRLANCYLPESPCGCDFTAERWSRDREEMSIDVLNIELVESTFGVTMRGAQFAHSVFSSIPPLGTR